MINAIYSNASVTFQESGASGDDAKNLAIQLLENDSPLRELEQRGYGLSLDQEGFLELLTQSLQKSLDSYKQEAGIEGDLSENDKSRFIGKFVGKAETLLQKNPELSENLDTWLEQVSDIESSDQGKSFAPSAYTGQFAGPIGLTRSVSFTAPVAISSSPNQKALQEGLNWLKEHLAGRSGSVNTSSDTGKYPDKDGDLKDMHFWDFLSVHYPYFYEKTPYRTNVSAENAKELIGLMEKLVSSGWEDVTSATGGRNVLDVYQSKFNGLTKARSDKQKELKEKTDLAKYLANGKADVTAALKKAADKGWNDKDDHEELSSLLVADYPKVENGKVKYDSDGKVVLEKKHLYKFIEDFYPKIYGKLPNVFIFPIVNAVGGKFSLSKNDLDVIQSQLDALTKSANDEAQLMTTDLQDINSQYNNITEAISKFIQKMYETSRAFIR